MIRKGRSPDLVLLITTTLALIMTTSVHEALAQGVMESHYMKISTQGSELVPETRITPAQGYPSQPTGIAVAGDHVYITTRDERDGNGEAYFLASPTSNGSQVGPYTRLTNTPTDTRYAMPAANGAYDPDYLVVVFTDNAAGQYDWYFTKSTDAGATWTSPALAVDPAHDIMGAEYRSAAVAMDDNGAVHLCWCRESGYTTYDYSGVYYARYDGTSWSGPTTIRERGPTYIWYPAADIGVGRNGILHIVFGRDNSNNAPNRNDDGDILYSRSLDGGTTWSTPVNINAFGWMDCGYRPSLDADNFGYVYYAVGGDWYSSYYWDEMYFRRSANDGVSWASQMVIGRSTPWNEDRDPVLMCDDSGGVYVVYSGDRYQGLNFKYSTDHGSHWTPENGTTRLFVDHEGLGSMFFAALDDDGAIHIVYRTRVEIYPAMISGTVTADGSPLGTVTVDLFDPAQTLLASRVTSENGAYEFADLDPGDYRVELVAPLGYRAAEGTQLEVDVTAESGDAVTVDFVLERFVGVAEARSAGYWKHQYKVIDSGHGHAHEPLEALLSYQDGIFGHFYARADEHAIEVSRVTHSQGAVLTFEDALATLSTRGSAPMSEKAGRQLLALLLNVVSGKLATYHVASEDARTVAQVIAYMGNLLMDGNPANDEEAKNLAEMVNCNELIPAGTIPMETPDIAYRRPLEPPRSTLSLAQPNPTKGFVRISYAVPPAGANVSLKVFDHAGRLVRTLVNGQSAGGVREILWAGDDDQGRHLTGGVYFYEIHVGEQTESRRVILW